MISDDELELVADVYRSGWLSMGYETELFEQELANYAGTKHAIAMSSGTAALQLACLSVGLRPDDEVIVPSMTFVATVSAIVHASAVPVFADVVGKREPWLSASAAAAAIGPRTRAIMAMSYGGHSGEIEMLRDICTDRGLLLLEDAAHALGSRLGGKQLGTFGDAGTFSFFANKNLPVGEGGAVITDNDGVARRLRLLRSHCMTSDQSRAETSTYDVVKPGFNCRIDEPRAALARRRLARLDTDNTARRYLDQRYREALADLNGMHLALEPVDRLESAHHLFTIVLDAGFDRRAFTARLADKGIQTGLHYPPVHRFSAYTSPGVHLPQTDEYADRAVTLPLFPHMSERQQDHVISAVRESLATVNRTR